MRLKAAQGGNSQDCESLIDIGADVNWKGQGSILKSEAASLAYLLRIMWFPFHF